MAGRLLNEGMDQQACVALQRAVRWQAHEAARSAAALKTQAADAPQAGWHSRLGGCHISRPQ